MHVTAINILACIPDLEEKFEIDDVVKMEEMSNPLYSEVFRLDTHVLLK